MVLLTLAMIRSRRTQAITVFLMAAVAVAAAVASGAYVNAAQQRILADDVAAAPREQKTLTLTEPVVLKAEPDDQQGLTQVEASKNRDFEHNAPALVRAEGFATVSSARYPAFLSTRPFQPLDGSNGALEFRQKFCAHVVLVQGRCVSGPGEVVVSPARAAAGLGVSQTLVSTPLRFVVDPFAYANSHYEPSDRPANLVVVGVYEPRDARDLYWGSTAVDLQAPGNEPVLTDRETLTETPHPEEVQSVIFYPLPGTIALDRVAAVGDTVARVRGAAQIFAGGSDIPTLLATIDRNSARVALVAGVATVPLIALCWYVLFLTIAYTAQARRAELGMIKLRGVSTGDQWWIAATESLLPVLAGGAAGYLLGHLAVWVYARAFFGGVVSVAVTTGPLPYAAVVLAGAVLAGLIAMRRDLASSATELLRRVPTPRRGGFDMTLAVLVTVLAGMAMVQLHRTSPGADGQSGLGRLAPALSIISLALLGAALVDPLMGRLGNWALRRGRIALTLAGLHVGRRRGGSRLFALVTVSVALLTFATTAAAYADAERVRQVGLAAGADKVVSLSTVSPFALLTAVRSVDPAGDYAMAAMPLVTAEPSRTMLAVDSPRLPKVAIWPDANGPMTAQKAVLALRPPTPGPIEIRGTGLAVSARQPAEPSKFPVSLLVSVARLDTGAVVRYPLSPPTSAPDPYTAAVACSAGCRLVDLQIVSPVEAPAQMTGSDPEVILESLRQTGPDRELASGADLARWANRGGGELRTEATDTGLRATVVTFPKARGLPILPQGTPVSLPTLNAGESIDVTVDLQGDQRITAAAVASAALLPKVGAVGGLTDLESLVRSGGQVESPGEVWLGPAAPADVADRLTAAGLTIISVTSLADQLAAAERRPSAVSLRFLLIVAMFGLVLGAIGLVVAAAVERRTRAEELRALRVQGLAPAPALRSVVVSYVLVVGVAVGFGVVAGNAIWYATGQFLPVVDARVPGLAFPLLPGLAPMLTASAGGVVLVAVAATLAGLLARTSHPSGGVHPRQRT